MKGIKTISLLMLLVLLGCRKDKAVGKLPPCATNPCSCVHEVTAEFETYEGFYTDLPQSMTLDFMHESLIEPGQTGSTSIELHAIEENANYMYIIENDTFYNRVVGFSPLIVAPAHYNPGDSLLITLIVEKTPSPCFPNDDGKDTVSKYVYFSVELCQPLWEDTFRGVWEGEPFDTFDISLEEFNGQAGHCRGDLKATNFGKLSCTQVFYGKHSYTSRKMVFYDADNSCMLDNGWVEVPFPQKDSIFCEYYLEVSLGAYVKKRFKGKRLP